MWMRRQEQGRIWMAGVAAAVILGTLLAIVLLRKPQDAEPSSAPSPAEVMLAEVQQFRASLAQLEPGRAVKQWFALYDRLAEFDADEPGMEGYDFLVNDMVGEQSLLASLPPPPAWPAFREEAARRAEADATRKTLGLRYLAELLMADRSAALATLDALAGESKDSPVPAARALLSRIYGDAAAQVAAFDSELDLPGDEYDTLGIPDLVALAGEPRATELLTKAVRSKRVLRLHGPEATQRLARRVALANVAQMKQPQWSLACSIEAAPLYEAMSNRFKAGGEGDGPASWSRNEATTYYFLAMVLHGRHAQAEQALVGLTLGNDSLSIPHAAVEALRRAQANEPVYRFLDELLQRRPEVRAWDLYLEQAAFTGNSKAGLARVESLLARKDLTVALRADLRARRFAALLAADQIPAAQAAAMELLAGNDKAASQPLQSRIDAASRALLAGRLIGNDQLRDAGLGFLKSALTRVKEDQLSEVRGTLYKELRRLGRGDEALAIASAASEAKPVSFSEAVTRRMGQDTSEGRPATVELAGIHSAAGRHDLVVKLLGESPRWAAVDLGDLLTAEDSQGVPMGVIAARALAATGDSKAALRVARATVAALPGNDAGYELIAALDADAPNTFDQLFAGDPYEERPLIWKASLQLAKGAVDETEATIRQAIAIDPSDGEEGPNDRMRAYAVLAQVLEKQGDASDARLYANAVAAIRLSEHGDQLHAAGLFDRAFRTYREALDKFSDAYCIQSRLAVQLNKQGRRQEALVHYRRAYELMPSSFGRVESHCFGCESVFVGAEAQGIAERVFTDVIRKSPDKPQAYYLLSYLREQQGRYEEALPPLRSAVSLDPQYLNAWKRLDSLGQYTFIEAGERDIAKLKLLDLDPLRRHARYDVSEVGDLRALWLGAHRAHQKHLKLQPPTNGLFRLEASARVREAAEEDMPSEMLEMNRLFEQYGPVQSAARTIHEHVLVQNVVALMGLAPDFNYVE
jgi:tetratricopeptide (TPR) repeat protein